MASKSIIHAVTPISTDSVDPGEKDEDGKEILVGREKVKEKERKKEREIALEREVESDIKNNYPGLSCTLLKHLRDIYDSLRGLESSLSQGRYENWLIDVQKVSNYKFQEEKVYKFEDWLDTLYANRSLEAQREPEPMDLTKPLSNYYISSSHNTYLSGNQWLSKSKTKAYKNVLRRGCRCIEVDVHNGDSVDIRTIEDRSNISALSRDSSQSYHQPHVWTSRASLLLEKAKTRLMSRSDQLVENELKSSETSINSRDRVQSSSSSSSSVSSSSDSEDTDSGSLSRHDVTPGEPIVMHGWTLTAPVGFRAVCRVIAQEAFKASELPIIVSLEVHTDLEQQETMVRIMKEEWGDCLVQVPIGNCNPSERLPRLEEMKKKILVKVKKGHQQPKPRSREQDGSLEPKSPKKDSEKNTSESKKACNSTGDEGSSTVKKKIKICDNLGKLGVYTHTEHFSGFTSASAQKPAHIFSIGESDLIEIVKNQRENLFAHNRNFILRTYPGATRIGSSNPDPAFFWRQGTQIVAMNWQKLDEGMMLNEGMFSGQHGWVLKPPGYRSCDVGDSTKISPQAIPAVTKTFIEYYQTIELNITILAGQYIPIPSDTTAKKFCPYVRGELHIGKENIGTNSAQRDNNSSSITTKLKQHTPYLQGDQLDFGKKGYLMKFSGQGIIQEELSFFRFKIEDSRYMQDDLAAWACIRLDRLQQGYRLVRLLDTKARATPGMLLVKIEKNLDNYVCV